MSDDTNTNTVTPTLMAKIGAEGFLYLRRGKADPGLKLQICPYTSQIMQPCGDWCPLFELFSDVEKAPDGEERVFGIALHCVSTYRRMYFSESEFIDES